MSSLTKTMVRDPLIKLDKAFTKRMEKCFLMTEAEHDETIKDPNSELSIIEKFLTKTNKFSYGNHNQS